MTKEKIQRIRFKVRRDTMQYSTCEMVLKVLDELEQAQAEIERLKKVLEAISRGLFSTRNAQLVAQKALKGGASE